MSNPRKVPKALEGLFADPVEAKAYVMRQKQFFAEIPRTNGDFTQWLAIKLSCKRTEAEAVIKWADL